MIEILLSTDEYKCTRCKNHLSVAPILALNNNEYVCGRCENSIYEDNSNPKTERQTLYEKLAENVRFPCCNSSKGCEKSLQWDEVVEHEKTCVFDVNFIECIFNAEELVGTELCEWKGRKKEYFKHLEINHSRSVKESEKLDIWERPVSQVLRFDFFNRVVLVFLLFFENVYHFAVVGKNKKSIEYKVSFSDESTKNYCVFTGLIDLLPFKIDDIRKYKLKFSRESLIEKYFSISFQSELKCDENCNAISLPFCDRCREAIEYPEVYKCNYTGHIICINCFSSRYVVCTLCLRKSSPILESKLTIDTDLQNSISNKHFKCDNVGCSYHGNFDAIRCHQQVCKAIADESFLLSKLNYAYEMSSVERFFEFDDSIFKLSRTQRDNTLTLQVSIFESTDVKYKFEISIFDSDTFFSFSFLPDFDLSVNFSKYLIDIPKILLAQFESSGAVKFKLNISKI